MLDPVLNTPEEGCKGPCFEDPRVMGTKEVGEGCLDDYLKGEVELDPDEQDNNIESGEADIICKLYHAV